MGMYTELAIGVSIKDDSPVVGVVGRLMGDGSVDFGDNRDWMLRSGGSYYFDGLAETVFRHDYIARAWRLTLWTNIKNYEDEWGWFLDLIAPHLSTSPGDYIGHMRYEEEERPTLLYAADGGIVAVSVPGSVVVETYPRSGPDAG